MCDAILEESMGCNRNTQGRDADEGFRRRSRRGPGAPPMLLASFSVWHIFFKFQLNQPGLALLQGFFLLYTYIQI